MRVKHTLFAWMVLAPAVVFGAEAIPSGWLKAGSHPAEYEVGADAATRHGGRASGFVRATAKELHGFGTLMQTSGPGEYAGKRIRMSAFVKSEKVESGWAGVWLRVDGQKQGEMLAFDNMQGRPIKGTSDWKRVDIVLDVAPEARDIAFGILLAGDGEVWIDDLKFEVVPASVPVTSGLTAQGGPANLDFEK